jgi:hypothetical protein
MSRSTTESMYKSMANTATDLCWLQSLLSELGVFLPTTPILFCDNIGSTYFSVNPIFHARTKHIAIDYHFVRNRVATKSLIFKFLSSKDQIADVLTKPLVAARFDFLKSYLNVFAPPSQLRAHIRTDSYPKS